MRRMNRQFPAAVIGAGAWGTAIAWSLAENGVETRIWAYEKEVADSINTSGENRVFLPGVPLPGGIAATTDMAEAVEGSRIVLIVVPSQFLRKTLRSLATAELEGKVIVSATKGIENDTLAMPVDMVADTLPDESLRMFCCLSGPTFAKELVKKTPTAATIASGNPEAARMAQQTLSAPYFRLYVHDDVTGVELGGAVKNVIAIAAGISDGLGFGNNTRAALITRGLSEMTRLGVAMGAKKETFAGLSGVGDLVLTCAGDLSRNRTVGLRLGKGERIDQITSSMTAVAEGVATSLSVHRLAQKHGVETPIASEVYKVIYEGKEPGRAVEDLMSRELKTEFY